MGGGGGSEKEFAPSVILHLVSIRSLLAFPGMQLLFFFSPFSSTISSKDLFCKHSSGKETLFFFLCGLTSIIRCQEGLELHSELL